MERKRNTGFCGSGVPYFISLHTGYAGYNAVGARIATGGSLAKTELPTALAGLQYNADNRLINNNGTAYTYDNNGNLTSDGARTYTWNARNQLTAISGADTANFTYDAFGRRRSATISGQTVNTLYDG